MSGRLIESHYFCLVELMNELKNMQDLRPHSDNAGLQSQSTRSVTRRGRWRSRVTSGTEIMKYTLIAMTLFVM